MNLLAALLVSQIEEGDAFSGNVRIAQCNQRIFPPRLPAKSSFFFRFAKTRIGPQTKRKP